MCGLSVPNLYFGGPMQNYVEEGGGVGGCD